MVLMLPKVKGFGEQFGEALGSGIQRGTDMGINFSQQMALQQAKQKQDKKLFENEKFETGLDTIRNMREILGKGNVGRGSGFLGFFPGETAKDRSELEQLGKSLIPLVAAGVPIRNQKEFEEYKKTITNPSSAISDLEGALNGLEKIFSQKLSGAEVKESSKKGKVKFSLTNPEHKAKRDQVLRDTKNDREKAEKILRREFEL